MIESRKGPTTKHFVAPAIIVAVSLATSALLALVIWWYNPDYLRDTSACRIPDSGVYLSLGRNLVTHAHYSRYGEPYLPEHVVPPVYPFVVGVLDRLGGAPAIYIAQALLRAVTCLLVYLAAKGVLGKGAGLWAGLFMALDLYHLVYSMIPMSETLFLTLLAAGLVLVLPPLFFARSSSASDKVRSLGGGCLLGLAILTRPAGLYAPFVLLIVCGLIWWYRGLLRPMWSSAALVLGGSYGIVGLWILRNYCVFSLPVVGVAGHAFPVYLTGASAYAVEHNISLEEAHAMIAKEFELPTEREVAEPGRFNRTIDDIAQDVEALRLVKWRVLFKYPRSLVYSSLRGVLKVNVGHPLEDFGKMIGRPWVNPGSKALIFSPREAWGRVWENPMPVRAMFIFHLVFAPVFLLLAAGGVLGMLRSRQTRPLALALMAVTAYFYLTVAMAGCDVEDRYRLPAFVFLSIFAGWAAARLIEMLQHRRRRAIEAQRAMCASM